MKTRAIFLLAASLLVACMSYGEESARPWQFAGWYGGGCYPNIEFDARVPGRVYLASDVAGIWRSDDRGENWHFINEGLGNLRVCFIAIAPSDPHVLYVGTTAGLFRSSDAGGRWERCGTASRRITFIRPENYRSVVVSESDPARLVVGTSKGEVFYSENAGGDWRPLGNQKNPLKAVKPIAALTWTVGEEILYAASEAGLTQYSFKTDRWQLLKDAPTGISDLYVSKKLPSLIYAAGQNILHVSKDGGTTWSGSSPVPKGVIYRLGVVESENSPIDAPQRCIIYAACNDGWSGEIVMSKDGGLHWDRLDEKMNSDKISNPTRAWAGVHSRMNSLKVDPFDAKVLFRTDWWGVWRSDDGGVTWNEKIKGAPNTVGSDITVSPSGDIYVATMDDGLLKSSNSGKTYQPVFPVEGHKKGLNGHAWRVIAIDANRIRATSSPWDEKINQIVLSDDAGQTFKTARSELFQKRPKINTVWGEGYPKAVAFHPKDFIFYLGVDGDDGGLFVSRDSGWHWERTKGQPALRKIYNGLAVDPDDSKRILWGAIGDRLGGISLSEDGGATWVRVLTEMRKVFDIAFAPDGTVYAAGEKNGPCVYISRDRGRHWRFLRRFARSGSAEALSIDPLYPKRLTVSTVQWDSQSGGKIYLSENTGARWVDITAGLPNGTGAAATAFNPHDGFLYVLRYAGSVYKLKMERL